MSMQNVKTILSRILSFLLAVAITLPLCLQVNLVTVKADNANRSQSIIKAYMGLMNSKKISALEDDLKNLNENDLKVISLFLSNFYTPFGTSLEEGSSGATYTECVSILQSMNFDADAAKSLVSTVFSCALSYRSPVVYSAADVNSYCARHTDALGLSGKGENGNKPYVDSSNDKYLRAVMGQDYGYKSEDGTEYYPLTVFTFWAILSGFNEIYLTNHVSGYEPSIPFYKVVDSEDKGTYVDDMPIFKINHAFSVVFGDLVDDERIYTNGRLCNAMWNGETDDIAFTEPSAFKLTPFGEALYVDWCGDIYADMGDRRVIIVPAVMNPVAFFEFNPDTKERIDKDICYLGSSFGVRIINHTTKNNSGQPTYAMACNTKAVEDFYRKQRGSHDVATWDTGGAGDTGWAGDLEEMLKSNGISTNGGDNNDWDANRCYMTIPDRDACNLTSAYGDNAVWTFLCYDAKFSDKTVIKTDILNKNDAQGNPFYYKDMFLSNGQSAFTNLRNEYNTIVALGDNDAKIFSQFFLTYVYMYAQGLDGSKIGTGENFAQDISGFNYGYNADVFPESDAQIDFATTNVTAEEIQSFLYLLLHPTKGIDYFVTWIKGKISGLFISWHEDIVGNTHTNVTTGMTKYLGFSGYVTIPSLHDISFLNWLVTNYDLIVVYLILIMFAVLMCYVLVGQLEFKRAVVGLVIFAVLAFLPTRVISGSLSLINTISDTLYSSKFDYWAIVQNQEYLSTLVEDITTIYTSDADIAVAQKSNKSEGSEGDTFSSSTQSVSLVRLKWPSPKRSNDIYRLQDELTSMNTTAGNVFTDTFISILTNSVNSANQTEEFVDDATYLYRNYMDVYSDAMITYNIMGCYSNRAFAKGFDYEGEAYTDDNVQVISNVISASSPDYKIKVPDSLANNPNTPDILKNGYYYPIYDSGKDLLTVICANADYQGASEGLRDTTSIFAIKKGFLYSKVAANSNNYYGADSLATSYLIKHSGKIVKPAAKGYVELYNTAVNGLNLNRADLNDENKLSKLLYGIDPRMFEYYKNDILLGNFKEGSEKKLSTKDGRNITNGEKLGYLYYTLYSESPFYFFNYNVRDQIKTVNYTLADQNGFSANHGYAFDYRYIADTQMEKSVCNVKNLFLQSGKGNYFYNYNDNAADGYGYLRDYMNMHDFFYYICPILRQGNRTVRLFDDLYKLEMYDDCSYRLDDTNSIYYDGMKYPSNSAIFTENGSLTEEQIYKLWHNMNMYTVFNMYTPWLDVMYDCDYAKPETIRVAGEDFYVQNPLDPTSYFTTDSNGNLTGGRYMVFSESEQHYYGLKDGDLTEVERKLIKVQRNVYNKSLDLMNYYTLNDEILIQAFSMIQLFEFNKEFSQKNIVSSVLTLYPQGFELKTFTFDAYLRLIMAGSSNNIDLMSADSNGNSGSIYSQIMKNTSIFYGIFLLINDILCVYVIPLLRFVFIIIILIMSIALIVFGAIKLYDDTGMTMTGILWQSLIKPIGQFTLITCGLALVVSLLMFGGPSGVTATTQTISLGDPTMTLILLIVLNSAVIVLYWKLVMSTYKELAKFLKAIVSSITGAVSGAIGTVAKMAIGAGVMKRFKQLANGSVVSDGVASGSVESRGRKNTGIAGSSGASSTGTSAGGAGIGGGTSAGGGMSSGGTGTGGALAGIDGEGSAPDGLGSGNSKLDETFDNMSSDAQSKVDKEDLSNSINKSRQNVQAKYDELQGAKSKYDDYKRAKEAKHANTHTGKFEKAKEEWGKEGANFNEAKTAFKNSKGAEKGTAFVNMVGSGARQVKNGLSAAKEGVVSAPARFVKAKVGKHFSGGFIDGMVHAKENNLKNDVAKAQAAYDTAHQQHSRKVHDAGNRLNGLERQANFNGNAVDKSIARHNAKRGTNVQRRQADIVPFRTSRNQQAFNSGRA